MRPKIIQIFLHDTNDPSSIKVAKLSNSIAQIFVIPRSKLDYIKTQKELAHPALYMLFDDERTSVYIGECENFTKRVKKHVANKTFWQTAVICVASDSSGLNKAQVKYLESHSITNTIEAGRYEVQNSNIPNRPSLHEFDLVATMDYLTDAELLLTSLGYNVFEPLKDESKAEPIITTYAPKIKITRDVRQYDTIVSPCSEDGFQKAFIEKSAWWAVRIGQTSIPKLKYIALYEAAPISAIRAYAKITSIEPYPSKPGYYMIHHDSNIVYLKNSVKLGNHTNLALQRSRYFKLEDIIASKDLSELTTRAFRH